MKEEEQDAIKLSDKGMDAIKEFVTGFSKFMEDKKILHQKEVLKAYSKMNIATLIYNGMILKEELNKRVSK